MNSVHRFFISLLVLVISINTTTAQPSHSQPRADMNMEEFADFQLDIIIKQLRLDETNIESFTKLYIEYNEKMNSFQQHPRRRVNNAPQNNQERVRPTAEEVEAEILNSFEMIEKSTALKREYYYKFKEILSPQQILRMYNTERRLRERMLSEAARRSSKEAQSAQ